MDSQDSSNWLVQKLLSQIDQDWTTSCTHDGHESAFVSQASIKTFLETSTQTRALIVAGCGENAGFSSNLIIRDCPIGLCILLRLGKGEYIGRFIEHAGLWDKNLPFFVKPDDFPHVPEEPTFFEAFQEQQWRFFPVTVPRTRFVKFQKERPLPIVESVLLKEGDTARLHHIRIHPEYDNTSAHQRQEPKDYALKTYIGKRAESYYRTEVENFAKLCIFHREPPEGLIRFHCGFEHKDTFNLLLDFATFGSLRDLLGNEESEEQAPEPPSSGQDIVRLWEQFSLCIQALNRIHELDLSNDDAEGSRVFQGWHQDIRPENILIHRCGDSSMPHDYRFLLGDLGLSHFVRMCRDKDDPSALDTGGTRTYGAPELYRHSDFDAMRRLVATRAIDIWSLGCVMLDLCVWIVRGGQYLENFGLRREEMNDKLGFFAGDCFHDGQQPLPDLSTVVQDEMYTLLDDVRVSDHITEPVLEVIKRMLRPDPKQRPTAHVVLKDMEVAIKEAKEQCNIWYTRSRHRSRSNTHGRSFFEGARPQNQANAQLFQSPVTPSMTISTLSTGLPPPRSALPFPEEREIDGTCGQAETSNDEPAQGTRPDVQTYQSSPVIFTSNLETNAAEDSALNSSRPHASTFPGHQNGDFLVANHDLLHPNEGRTPEAEPPEGRRSYDPDRQRKPRRQKVPYLSRDDAIKWKAGRKKLFGPKPPLDFDHYRKWLNERDHVFIIDDSRTMNPYKEHVTTLLSPLVYTVKAHDPDGVEVHFTISSSRQQSRKSGVLIDEVERHRFEGKTDISIRLGSILRRYRVELDDHRNRRQSKRAMSIYILTDGVWEGGQDAQTPIRELITVLKQYKYDRKQVGIQFIRFGNDDKGFERLAELDQFGKQPDVGLDIVDTESSFGNVWKMLLGAIDETFDDEFSDVEV